MRDPQRGNPDDWDEEDEDLIRDEEEDEDWDEDEDEIRAELKGKRIVSAIFRDADEAEDAYDAAIQRGYSKEKITVLMSEQARGEYFPGERVEIERHSKALEGSAVGGVVGAGVGALAAALAAVGTIVAIPPLGLVVAGPLAAALTGAGAGGITGGIIGALVGSGLNEDRARVYKTAIQEGGIVLAVRPATRGEGEDLAEAWEDCGGEEVHRSWATRD